MAKPDDEGPLLVWSFPLIRTLQNRDGILSVGLGNVLNNQTSDRGERRSQRTDHDASSDDIEDDDILDDIEDSIDELDSNSDILYEDSEGVTVQISEEGFDPTEVDIGIGDTVTWVNQGDTTARISSTDDDFTSPILDPGDTYEETFYTPQDIEYKDPTSGSSERGMIRVGPELESSDVDPVPFDSEDNDSDNQSSESARSMDQAVTDKDDDDRGF